jgi:hypothetical protein
MHCTIKKAVLKAHKWFHHPASPPGGPPQADCRPLEMLAYEVVTASDGTMKLYFERQPCVWWEEAFLLWIGYKIKAVGRRLHSLSNDTP